MTKTAPSQIPHRTRARFLAAGLVSLLAWVTLWLVAPGGTISWTETMAEAAAAMEASLGAAARHCAQAGIPRDRGIDPNGTCLVGPEDSELFTSLGQLEAKRTATNPDMAGLLVHLLSRAGVGEGDTVAIGASGSFPALMVASLVAVRALGAEPVAILSLGASSYGATRPSFHLLDLYRLLESEGVASRPPAAVSLGGRGDMGEEFDQAFREGLFQELADDGVRVLREPDLRRNVSERIGLYGNVRAFVNIGGAESNLGTSPQILEVPPGLVLAPKQGASQVEGWRFELPPEEQRGVLFEMLSRRIPVIHLLHVRGLVLRYGLSWDPIPLPAAGSTRIRDARVRKGIRFWVLTLVYLSGLASVAFGRWGRLPSLPGRQTA